MKINNREIGKNFPPYIIAELSANHGGSIEIAKQSILEAKNSGASAVKIQTYTPDTMTLNCTKSDFQVREGLWAGKTLYDLYSEAYLPFEWHKPLFEYAKSINITLFSSPFDESAVDLLESLDVPAYKIASFEITDLPLVKYVASKNKPILISSGMATLEEISETLEEIRSLNNKDIILFHCISSYPALTKDSNLKNIIFLKEKFNVDVGLSDHTLSNTAAIASIVLGATVIEKHFKLDDTVDSVDSDFSLTASAFKSLVQDCNDVWLAQANKDFSRAESEKESLKYRRSIYFVKNIKKGSILREEDIKRVRPGYGLNPKFLKMIIGSRLLRDVEFGDPVTWEDIVSD